MCFIHLKQASNTVQHGLLLDVLRRFGFYEKLIRVYIGLYWEQSASVRVGDETSEWIELK